MAFLTIDRALINPDWDAKTKLLFLWLCEEASVSRHEWHGVMVEAGQYLTTMRDLAELFGCDVHTITRRFRKLKDYQSITIESIRVLRGKLGCQVMTLVTLQRKIESATNSATNNATKAQQINVTNSNSYNPSKIESATNSATNNATTKANIMSTNTAAATHASARTHEGGVGPIGEEDIPAVLAETLDKDVRSAMLLWNRTHTAPKAAAAYFADFQNNCIMLGKAEHGNPRQLVVHFASWLSIRLNIERREQQDKAAQAAKMERYADNKERTRSAIERNNDILDAMLRAASGVGTDGGNAPLIPDY